MRKCALCGNEAVLIDSHLLPRAAYKVISKECVVGLQKPIKLDSHDRTACYSDSQITSRLLCAVCEDLFSKNGEKHLGKLWSSGGSFPLLDVIRGCDVAVNRGGVKFYLPQKDLSCLYDGLFYFALSVYWRAHVWDWGRRGSVYAGALGDKYEEMIRRFLLGDGGVDNIYVFVSVHDGDSKYTTLSVPRVRRCGNFKIHEFDVPGISFSMFVGAERGCIYSFFRRYGVRTFMVSRDLFSTAFFDGLAGRVKSDFSVKGKLSKVSRL